MKRTSSSAFRPLAVRVALAGILLMWLCGFSCTLGPGQTDVTSLGVPFRQQLGWDYCGAASVLMWRLYNGFAEVDQSTIYASMGGSGFGVSPIDIANAAAGWAGVSDAYVDYGSQSWDEVRREYFARQISSIDNHVPVISIVESGMHSGVVNGGSWTLDPNTYLNVWNDVYFHDPSGYPDRSFPSASWMQYATGGPDNYTQIVSYAAVANWQSNYTAYGEDTVDSLGRGEPEEQDG